MQILLKHFAKSSSKIINPSIFRFTVSAKNTNLVYKTLSETNQNLPDKDHYHISYIERNEVEARLMKVLSNFQQVNLKSFKWVDDFEKDLKMDSLDQTVLLTSVEEEFNIVFEDRVFDNFKNLEQVIQFIANDSLAF